MYRPLFWISLGAVTMVVLALATVRELTRFQPLAEFHRSVETVAQAQTVTATIAFDWSQGEGNNRVVSTLYATGPFRLSGPSIGDYGLRFRLVRLSSGSTQYNDVSGELRSLGEKSYLTYTPPGPDVANSPFAEANTWLSLSDVDRVRWGPLLPGVPWPLTFTPDNRLPWSVDQLTQLVAGIRKSDVAYALGDGKVQTVNGKPCRAVNLRLDRASTEAFLLAVMTVKDGREPTNDERVRAATVAEQLSRFSTRVWIGAKDHRPYRVESAGTIVNGRASVPVSLVMDLANYDALFTQTPPEHAQSLATALPSLPTLSSSLGVSLADTVAGMASLPTFSTSTQDDADSDGLNGALELFYGTDPRNPDTDGDRVTDGEEVRLGCNPRGHGPLFGFGLGIDLNHCP